MDFNCLYRLYRLHKLERPKQICASSYIMISSGGNKLHVPLRATDNNVIMRHTGIMMMQLRHCVWIAEVSHASA